ncbi:MAG TPA: DUF6625 family protein [Duganella sp.]|nr:DUF6625 family protein [Duganella sp.]
MKSIAILIDYLGTWPKWFPVFLASCERNATINWIIRTDCDVPETTPKNVKFVQTSYLDYIQNVSEKLNINFSPSGNYKICDIKPAYGDLYHQDICDFDYYGFGDLDVIYGDMRKFYTDEVLSFDVISTHEKIVSGHLCLFKNTEALRKAYLNIPRWKLYMEYPYPTRFDEDVYSLLFVRPYKTMRSDDFGLMAGLNLYFKEQYTTVFHPTPWHDGMEEHPDVWFWKNGVLTNNRNLDREYLYLHLMNFQSMRWMNPDSRKNNIAWSRNPDTLFTRYGEEKNGVRIDWQGIQPWA